MSHRQNQAREYVQRALEEAGAFNLKYEMRGKHPAFMFDVRLPTGAFKRGQYTFSQTPRIDKDLNMITQARRYVRELTRSEPLVVAKDALISRMVDAGHDEFLSGLIARQFELGDKVARQWVEEFLLREERFS